MGRMYCCVKGCNNHSDGDVSLFRIPSDDRCGVWLKNCGRMDLSHLRPIQIQANYRVCYRHFDDSMFASLLKNRLKKTAIPTLFAFKASDFAARSEVHKGAVIREDKKICQYPKDLSDEPYTSVGGPQTNSFEIQPASAVCTSISNPNASDCQNHKDNTQSNTGKDQSEHILDSAVPQPLAKGVRNLKLLLLKSGSLLKEDSPGKKRKMDNAEPSTSKSFEESISLENTGTSTLNGNKWLKGLSSDYVKTKSERGYFVWKLKEKPNGDPTYCDACSGSGCIIEPNDALNQKDNKMSRHAQNCTLKSVMERLEVMEERLKDVTKKYMEQLGINEDLRRQLSILRSQIVYGKCKTKEREIDDNTIITGIPQTTNEDLNEVMRRVCGER